MKLATLCLSGLLLGVAGCSTPGGTTASPLIPNKAFQVTAGKAVDLASVLLVPAAIYFIYDPLAPNWEIEEARLNEDTFHFSLKMKRYFTGGSGESGLVLRRRAAQLVSELGYERYEIITFNEGIESHTVGARRFAEGTIRLVNRRQADSFMLNEVN